MPTKVVELKASDVLNEGSAISAMVATNGSAPPLVTLSARTGFPVVTEILAAAKELLQKTDAGPVSVWGVGLIITFVEPVPADAVSITINLYQPAVDRLSCPTLSRAGRRSKAGQA